MNIKSRADCPAIIEDPKAAFSITFWPGGVYLFPFDHLIIPGLDWPHANRRQRATLQNLACLIIKTSSIDIKRISIVI